MARPRGEPRSGEEGAPGADPFVSQAVELLDSIPGVGLRTAQTIGAAIGVERSRFPPRTFGELDWSMAGQARVGGQPAERAADQGEPSVRTTQWKRRGPPPAKGTFLRAKYQRLGKRMPKLKALGAIAHRRVSD